MGAFVKALQNEMVLEDSLCTSSYNNQHVSFLVVPPQGIAPVSHHHTPELFSSPVLQSDGSLLPHLPTIEPELTKAANFNPE